MNDVPVQCPHEQFKNNVVRLCGHSFHSKLAFSRDIGLVADVD